MLVLEGEKIYMSQQPYVSLPPLLVWEGSSEAPAWSAPSKTHNTHFINSQHKTPVQTQLNLRAQVHVYIPDANLSASTEDILYTEHAQHPGEGKNMESFRPWLNDTSIKGVIRGNGLSLTMWWRRPFLSCSLKDWQNAAMNLSSFSAWRPRKFFTSSRFFRQ